MIADKRIFSKSIRGLNRIALRRFSTPERMAEAGAQEILLAWREEIKRPSLKRARALCSAAEQSIGRTKGSVSAVMSLQNIMTEYELLMMQMERVEELVQECLVEIPHASELLAIKRCRYGCRCHLRK